jgi:protease-4
VIIHLIRALLANLLLNLLAALASLLRRFSRVAHAELALGGPLDWRDRRRAFFQARRWSLGAIEQVVERVLAERRCSGLVIRLGRVSASWALLEQLRAQLARVAESKKELVVVLGDVGTSEYYLASVANRLVMSTGSLLDLRGLALELSFFGATLSRLGIEAEVVRAGAFKSAGERFTHQSISPENRLALEAYVDEVFELFVSDVARARDLTRERVSSLIDQGLFVGKHACEVGLVDELGSRDSLDSASKAGAKGISPKLKTVKAGRLIRRRRLSWYPLLPRKQLVVLSARGVIVSGKGAVGLSQVIAEDALIAALRRLERSRRVAAVVLHIDSPGGSGSASDRVWERLRALAKKKPLIASMGGVAASGGYYLASACDAICASRATLTGSIGVIGGKLSANALLNRLGIGRAVVKRGRRSAMFSWREQLGDDGREALGDLIAKSYQLFVERVADGRGLKSAEVDDVARGRIWSGRDAQQHRLVDELGGLDQAVEMAHNRARCKRGQLRVVDMALRGPRPGSSFVRAALLSLIPELAAALELTAYRLLESELVLCLCDVGLLDSKH